MIVEVNPAVKELVDLNDGYCPCAIWRNEDTLCPCLEFREMTVGVCNCGRYMKVNDKKGEGIHEKDPDTF